MKKSLVPGLQMFFFSSFALLTAIYFLSPATAGGADWRFIAMDDEGLWVYDADTVSVLPNHRIKVQTRKIYERKAVLSAVDKHGKKFENLDSVLVQWEIDCFQMKFQLCSAVFYSRENAEIEGYHPGKEGGCPPEDIPPGSYLELLCSKICR
jgi:hypothetical protein